MIIMILLFFLFSLICLDHTVLQFFIFIPWNWLQVLTFTFVLILFWIRLCALQVLNWSGFCGRSGLAERSGLGGRPDQTPVGHPAGLLLLDGHNNIALGDCPTILLRVGTLALRYGNFQCPHSSVILAEVVLSPYLNIGLYH